MPKYTNKELSVKQETEMAKLYGGKRSPSSGAQPHDRGDVRYRIGIEHTFGHDDKTYYDFTAECKVTRARQITIRKETWDKIEEEAREQDRRPCMFIRFYDGHSGRYKDLVIRSVEDDREMHS
jgi:hypothetical protein